MRQEETKYIWQTPQIDSPQMDWVNTRDVEHRRQARIARKRRGHRALRRFAAYASIRSRVPAQGGETVAC